MKRFAMIHRILSLFLCITIFFNMFLPKKTNAIPIVAVPVALDVISKLLISGALTYKLCQFGKDAVLAIKDMFVSDSYKELDISDIEFATRVRSYYDNLPVSSKDSIIELSDKLQKNNSLTYDEVSNKIDLNSLSSSLFKEQILNSCNTDNSFNSVFPSFVNADFYDKARELEKTSKHYTYFYFPPNIIKLVYHQYPAEKISPSSSTYYIHEDTYKEFSHFYDKGSFVCESHITSPYGRFHFTPSEIEVVKVVRASYPIEGIIISNNFPLNPTYQENKGFVTLPKIIPNISPNTTIGNVFNGEVKDLDTVNSVVIDKVIDFGDTVNSPINPPVDTSLWDKLWSFLQDISDSIKAIPSAILDLPKNIYDKFREWLESLRGDIKTGNQAITGQLDSIGKDVIGGTGAITGELEGIKNAIKDIDKDTTNDITLDNVKGSALSDTIMDGSGFAPFQNSLEKLTNIKTSKGPPPILKINLHKIFIASTERFGSPNSTFEDKDSIFVDFGILEKYKFGGFTLIDYFRFLISSCMLISTALYVHRKFLQVMGGD